MWLKIAPFVFTNNQFYALQMKTITLTLIAHCPTAVYALQAAFTQKSNERIQLSSVNSVMMSDLFDCEEQISDVRWLKCCGEFI